MLVAIAAPKTDMLLVEPGTKVGVIYTKTSYTSMDSVNASPTRPSTKKLSVDCETGP